MDTGARVHAQLLECLRVLGASAEGGPHTEDMRPLEGLGSSSQTALGSITSQLFTISYPGTVGNRETECVDEGLREDANFGPYDEGGKDLRRGDGCEKEMPEDKEEKRTRAHCRVLAHVQGTDSLMPHLLIETIETSPSPSPARSCDKESSHADPVGKAGRKRGEWVRAAGGWIDALVDFLPRVNVAAMDQADGDLSRLDQISRHYAHVTKVLEANSLRACNSLARSARNDEGSKQNGLGSEASEGTRPQEHENAWAEREKKEGKGKQEVKPCVVGRICGDLPSSGQAVALSCERRTRVLSTPLGDEGRSARAHGVGAHGGSVLGNGGGAGDENSEECWLYDLIRDLVWEWTSLLRSPLFLCDIGRLGGVRAGQGGHWDQGARRIQSSRTNGQSQGGEESLGVLTGRILKQYLEQDSEIKRRLFSRSHDPLASRIGRHCSNSQEVLAQLRHLVRFEVDVGGAARCERRSEDVAVKDRNTSQQSAGSPGDLAAAKSVAGGRLCEDAGVCEVEPVVRREVSGRIKDVEGKANHAEDWRGRTCAGDAEEERDQGERRHSEVKEKEEQKRVVRQEGDVLAQHRRLKQMIEAREPHQTRFWTPGVPREAAPDVAEEEGWGGEAEQALQREQKQMIEPRITNQTQRWADGLTHYTPTLVPSHAQEIGRLRELPSKEQELRLSEGEGGEGDVKGVDGHEGGPHHSKQRTEDQQQQQRGEHVKQEVSETSEDIARNIDPPQTRRPNGWLQEGLQNEDTRVARCMDNFSSEEGGYEGSEEDEEGEESAVVMSGGESARAKEQEQAVALVPQPQDTDLPGILVESRGSGKVAYKDARSIVQKGIRVELGGAGREAPRTDEGSGSAEISVKISTEKVDQEVGEDEFVSVVSEEGNWIHGDDAFIRELDRAARDVIRDLQRVSVSSLQAEALERTCGPYRMNPGRSRGGGLGSGRSGTKSVTIYLLNCTSVELVLARYGGASCVWPLLPPTSIPSASEVLLASSSAPGGLLGGGSGTPDAFVAYRSSPDEKKVGRNSFEFYMSWQVLFSGRIIYRSNATLGWRVEREYLTGNYGPHATTRFILTRSLPPLRFLALVGVGKEGAVTRTSPHSQALLGPQETGAHAGNKGVTRVEELSGQGKGVRGGGVIVQNPPRSRRTKDVSRLTIAVGGFADKDSAAGRVVLLQEDQGASVDWSQSNDSPENSPSVSPSMMGAAETVARASANWQRSREGRRDAHGAAGMKTECAEDVSRGARMQTISGLGGQSVAMVLLDCGCGTHSALKCTGERARHIVAWLQGIAFPHGVTNSTGLLDLVVLQGVHTETARQEFINGLSRSLDLRHIVTGVGSRSMGIMLDSGILIATRYPVIRKKFFLHPSNPGCSHPAIAVPKGRFGGILGLLLDLGPSRRACAGNPMSGGDIGGSGAGLEGGSSAANLLRDRLCVFTTVAADHQAVWRHICHSIHRFVSLSLSTPTSHRPTPSSPTSCPSAISSSLSRHEPVFGDTPDTVSPPDDSTGTPYGSHADENNMQSSAPFSHNPTPTRAFGVSSLPRSALFSSSADVTPDCPSEGDRQGKSEMRGVGENGNSGVGHNQHLGGLYLLIAGKFEGISDFVEYNGWDSLLTGDAASGQEDASQAVRETNYLSSRGGSTSSCAGRDKGGSSASAYVRTALIRDLLLDPCPRKQEFVWGPESTEEQGGTSAADGGQTGSTAVRKVRACDGTRRQRLQRWCGGEGTRSDRGFESSSLCNALARACALGTMSNAKFEYTWDTIHNALGNAAAGAGGRTSAAGIGCMPCRVSNFSSVDALLVSPSSPLYASIGGGDKGGNELVGLELGKVVCTHYSVEGAGVTATSQPSDHYAVFANVLLVK